MAQRTRRPKLATNAVGRPVPVEVNGREQAPYEGVGRHRARGRKHGPRITRSADYPANGDKRVGSLREALERCGLRDGMVISSHHHLRNGDRVAIEALRIAEEMKVRDLMWFPSASFPCHEPVIDMMRRGTVHHIEGSMNGPIGEFVSRGEMRGLGVVSLGSKMIDPPVVKRALALVDRAKG